MSDWAERLYAKVDAMDAKGFAEVFLPEGTLRFGNADVLTGPAAIEQAIAGFFGTIAGLRHENVGTWEVGDTTILEAKVTYTRKDGRHVTVPAVTIYRRQGDKARSCRIHVDLAPLYA